MKRALLIPLLLLLLPMVHAQRSSPGEVQLEVQRLKGENTPFTTHQLLLPAPNAMEQLSRTASVVDDAVLLRLDPEAVNELRMDAPVHLALAIPMEDRIMVLDLFKVEVGTPEMQVIVASTNAAVAVDLGTHYRGMVQGSPGSLVAISIFTTEVMGLISDENGTLTLGRLENDGEGIHVLYATDKFHSPPISECHTDTDGPSFSSGQLEVQPHAKSMKCVQLYWEADHDIFLNKGGVQNTTNFLMGLFNQNATLYSNDGMQTMMSELFIWDVPSPYTGLNSLEMLIQFREYRTTFNGDLSHLMNLKSSYGGRAYRNVLCYHLVNYRSAYSGLSTSYQNVPTYSWSVMVVAHEQGHQFGSRHTHDCAWNGDNSPIDGCGPEAGYPTPCEPGPLPTSEVGGTIMSYCYLTSSKVKFANGFGPQPVAVMINAVNAAQCLTMCTGSACDIPGTPMISNIQPASAMVSWGAVSGANTYTLQYKPAVSSTWYNQIGITSTSYQLTGLAPSATYDLKVMALCDGGNSDYTSDVSFTTAAPCTDVYEPNNAKNTATQVGGNSTSQGLIHATTDEDWFRFANTKTLKNIRVTLSNLPANYNLQLHRGNTHVATSQNSGTTDEVIILNSSTVSNAYYARVYSVQGAMHTSQCYTLTIEIGSSSFSMPSGAGLPGLVEEENTIEMLVYPNPASTTLTVLLPASEEQTSLQIFDAIGRQVQAWDQQNVNGEVRLVLDVSDYPAGIYLIRASRTSGDEFKRFVIER
jgi:hypothetical protein